MLDSFCGKDAQLQDDIDTKDSSFEASDQISSNVSTTLHVNEESQVAKCNVDLTVSPEKKRLRVDSFQCDHDCDMEKYILDGNKLTHSYQQSTWYNKTTISQYPRVTVNIVAV